MKPRPKSGLATAIEAAVNQMEAQKAKQDAQAQALIEEGKYIATEVAKGLLATAQQMPFVK